MTYEWRHDLQMLGLICEEAVKLQARLLAGI